MKRLIKVRIELNRDGVRQLLQSEDLGEKLEGLAEAISDRCGEGYAHDRKLMPTRVIASVYTDTPEAAKDNLQNNTILRALK